MRRMLSIIATFALFLCASSGRAQCLSNLDCKGDRVCVNGQCVMPPPPAPTPAPPPAYEPQPEPQPSYEPQPAPQPGYEPQPAPQPGYEPQPAPQPGYVQPGAAPQPGYAQPGYPAPQPGYPTQPVYNPPPPPREKAEKESYLRLNLELRPFGFTWTKIEYDGSYFDDGEGGIGHITEKDKQVGVGITPGTDFGLGIAYSHERHATVGLRLLLGFSVQTPEWKNEDGDATTAWGEPLDGAKYDAKSTSFRYGVMPYFEYAFADGPVRPFLIATLGLEGTTSEQTEKYSDPEYDYVETWKLHSVTNLFAVGLGGGVHFFFGDRASLDLWICETIGFGKRIDNDKWEAELDGDREFESDEYTHSVLTSQTDLFFGISAWL